MLYTKLSIFRIQYALSDNILANFAWLVKEFSIYNKKFQKKIVHIVSPERANTVKDFDHSQFIYFL